MENKYENKTTAREYSFKFLYFLLFEGDKTYLESLENDESSLDELINVFNESYIESDKEHPDNVLNSEILFFAKQVLAHTTTHLEEIKSIILIIWYFFRMYSSKKLFHVFYNPIHLFKIKVAYFKSFNHFFSSNSSFDAYILLVYILIVVTRIKMVYRVISCVFRLIRFLL